MNNVNEVLKRLAQANGRQQFMQMVGGFERQADPEIKGVLESAKKILNIWRR
jgi:hypothetical protein